jgi:methionine-rich copper-binding protein CopC
VRRRPSLRPLRWRDLPLWLMLPLWLAAPLAAHAHARLTGSVPAADATLDAAPRVLTLRFDEAVRLTSVKLEHDGNSTTVPLHLGAPASRSAELGLPALGPGAYEVRWSALTEDDGHIVSGRIRFVIRTVAQPPGNTGRH